MKKLASDLPIQSNLNNFNDFIMLKILQIRLQHYVNMKFQMFKLNQRSNCQHPLAHQKSKRVPDCVDHNKWWKTLEEMGIPDHLTCLLRNLYAGKETTVRTGHGTTDVPNRNRSTKIKETWIYLHIR